MPSFKVRIPLYLALTLLAAVVYLAADLDRGGHDQATRRFNSYETLLAEQLARETGERLQGAAGLLLHLANLAEERGGDGARLRADFQAFSTPTPGLQTMGILAIDPQQGVVYSSAPDLPSPAATSRIGLLEWAEQPANRGQIRMFSVPHEGQGRDTSPPASLVCIATPLWLTPSTASTQRWGGVLLASMGLEAFLEGHLPAMGPEGEPLGFWILDRDGTVLLQTEHPEMTLGNVRRPDPACLRCHASFSYVARMLSARRGTAEYQLVGQPTKLAAFAPMTFGGTTWIVVADASQEHVLAFVHRTLSEMSLLVGLLVVAFCFGSWSVYQAGRAGVRAQEEARQWKDRHEAEARLRRTEACYRVLFEQSPDGVLLLDPWTTRPIDFNESAHRALGYSREEFASLRVSDYEAVDSPPDTEARIAAILHKGRATFDTVHRTKQGRLLNTEVSAQKLDLDGRAVLHCIFHDVTEHVRAKERVATLHHQNALILDSVTEGILGLDADGCHTFVNSVAAQLLGWDADDLIGKNSHALWHHTWADGRVRDAAQCAIYAAYREGRAQHVPDDVFWRKDGTPLPVEFTSTPIREHNRLVGAVVSFRDLTERRRVEQALHENEAYFRALIENAMDITTVLNLDGTIRYESPSVERVLGYRADELIGRNVFDLVHPEDRAGVVAVFGEGSAVPGSTGSAVMRFRHKDGSWRTLKAIGRNLSETPGVRGIVVNSHDLTEENRLEAQLRQAQKMEAIGTLAGGIAHDFNNVLAAIVGYTELALSEVGPDQAPRECLVEVMKASQRAADLVRQILTFSRRQEQERRSVDLAQIVHDALKLMRATLPATVSIDTDIAEETPPVLADPTQLYQLFVNLAANSAHAMREHGGRLTVKVGPVQVDAAAAAGHPDLREGTYVRLTVADTGHGMDAATLERVFEPFFTTKPAGEGTGLGLSVVHGIVSSLEGAILVSSEPGLGTTFDIYVPIHETESAAAPPPAGPVPRGAGQRIMFVDDEPAIGRIATRILEGLGYMVETHADPAGALQAFEADPEAFDLVMTDLAMPGMSGLDLAGRLLRLKPGQRIVLLSGFSGTLTADKARQLGLSALLPKPVDAAALGRAAHEALRSVGRPGDPSASES